MTNSERMKDRPTVYWHEVSDEEVNLVLTSKMTVAAFMEKYSQPEWCDYPDALAGKMGCWSLIDHDLRKKISRDFCRNCECFKQSPPQ